MSITSRRRAHLLALRDERGSAVAEFAVALPAVLLVFATLLGGVQFGVLQLRLQDAAADAARLLGRGESSAAVASRLARSVPDARLSSTRSDGLVCARLLAAPTGPAGWVGLQVAGESCALDET